MVMLIVMLRSDDEDWGVKSSYKQLQGQGSDEDHVFDVYIKRS